MINYDFPYSTTLQTNQKKKKKKKKNVRKALFYFHTQLLQIYQFFCLVLHKIISLLLLNLSFFLSQILSSLHWTQYFLYLSKNLPNSFIISDNSFLLETCVTFKKQFIIFDKFFFLFNILLCVFLNIIYYLVMKCSSNRNWLEICTICKLLLFVSFSLSVILNYFISG